MNQELYQRGIILFNLGEFFAAHELLEDIWRAEIGPHKLFLQGLIQVAVAFHHHSTGNMAGARSVLARACRNLGSYPDQYLNLNLMPFRASLSAWKRALEYGFPNLPLPKLETLSDNLVC